MTLTAIAFDDKDEAYDYIKQAITFLREEEDESSDNIEEFVYDALSELDADYI